MISWGETLTPSAYKHIIATIINNSPAFSLQVEQVLPRAGCELLTNFSCWKSKL
jgi:hypothetical protein